MFKALRNNKGSAMIIYVCMFVVMLGTAAVAVDTGTVAVAKQRLQAAVDAAALAAAQELPDTSAAVSAANRYVALNGLSPSDITVSFENSGKIIVIHATRKVDYTFAKILGISSTNLGLTAKAACAQLGGAFVVFGFHCSFQFLLQASEINRPLGWHARAAAARGHLAHVMRRAFVRPLQQRREILLEQRVIMLATQQAALAEFAPAHPAMFARTAGFLRQTRMRQHEIGQQFVERRVALDGQALVLRSTLF
jgi:hypothetical protein